MTHGAAVATQGTVDGAIATITDSWVADAGDKDAIAQLCQRLGFDPAQVTGVRLAAGTRVGGVTGITVEVTRRVT